jgi:YD repeat-containing protein
VRATLSYDDDNRKTAETVSYPGPGGNSFSLSYGYTHSPAGRKTRLTWADGTGIDYAYSAHGELQTVTIPGEGTISVNQFQWTEPAQLTLPGGTVQEKGFDGLLILQKIFAVEIYPGISPIWQRPLI